MARPSLSQRPDILDGIKRENLATLHRWRCPDKLTVAQCLMTLLPHHQKMLVGAWFKLLPQDVLPRRIRLSKARLDQKKIGIQVVYNPARSIEIQSFTAPLVFKNACSENAKDLYSPVIPKVHVITDITLVVVMNFADLVRNIPMLEFLHARYFRHIIYCAASMAEFMKFYSTDPSMQRAPVSFVEAKVSHHNRGDQGYVCAREVLKMGYKTSGVLQLSDDVLLNTWNINHLPRNRPWFHTQTFKMPLTAQRTPNLCLICPGWWAAWPYFRSRFS